MNKNRSFAFDCDDVLCCFFPHFIEAYNLVIERHPEVYKELYDFRTQAKDFLHMDPELFKLFIPALKEIEAIEKSFPLPRAAETTRKLKQQGIDIHVVTARGWHPQGKALTKYWLDYWDFAVDKVHVIDVYNSKKDVLSGLNNCVGFVDDRISHIKDAEELNIPTYLYDHFWNHGYDSDKTRIVGSHFELQSLVL